MPELISFTNNETPHQMAALLISTLFTDLLESKHLYQSVQIPWAEQKFKIYSGLAGAADAVELLLGGPWLFESSGVNPSSFAPPLGPISFPTIRIYCARCDRVFPFKLNSPTSGPVGPNNDVLVLPLQCQSCERNVVFMVTRNHLKITLSGRSEIERVNAPRYIPAGVRRYYERAVIAYNSGERLAALCLRERQALEPHPERILLRLARLRPRQPAAADFLAQVTGWPARNCWSTCRRFCWRATSSAVRAPASVFASTNSCILCCARW